MPEQFEAALQGLGFRLEQEDRRGVRQYARRANRFLTEWIHDDGQAALFTWEFDLGEFCADRSWQLGGADTSLQILYPSHDTVLAREAEGLRREIRRVEDQLNGLNLADPAC